MHAELEAAVVHDTANDERDGEHRVRGDEKLYEPATSERHPAERARGEPEHRAQRVIEPERGARARDSARVERARNAASHGEQRGDRGRAHQPHRDQGGGAPSRAREPGARCRAEHGPAEREEHEAELAPCCRDRVERERGPIRVAGRAMLDDLDEEVPENPAHPADQQIRERQTHREAEHRDGENERGREAHGQRSKVENPGEPPNESQRGRRQVHGVASDARIV